VIQLDNSLKSSVVGDGEGRNGSESRTSVKVDQTNTTHNNTYNLNITIKGDDPKLMDKLMGILDKFKGNKLITRLSSSKQLKETER